MYTREQYYTQYPPIVNTFFEMAIREDKKEEIIPFLKNLTEEHKQQIAEAVALFDLAEEISRKTGLRYRWQNSETNEQQLRAAIEKVCGYIPRFIFSKGNPREAFQWVRYLCFTRQQIKNHVWGRYSFPTADMIDQIMEWYMPEWFTDYLREQQIKGDIFIGYRHILKWRRMGILEENSPNEIAEKLVRHFDFLPKEKREIGVANYITTWVHNYPEILEEARYLFQYPTSAYYIDHNPINCKELGIGPVSYLFKRYSDEGLLDRQWVLKQAATACSNNFPAKETIYWYPYLLEVMQPTVCELLSLQEELFAALSCIYTPVPIAILKMIRQIVKESAFRIDDLLPSLSMLLSAETKTVVKATLTLMGDLLKSFPEKRNELCHELTIVFIHKNEEIQVKGAKWIMQYAGKEEIIPVLTSYREMMLMAAREILKQYIDQGQPSQANGLPQNGENHLSPPNEGTPIPEIDSLEELVFRLGDAFERFPPGTIDHIPQALIRFNTQIDAEVMLQFSPAIKAAEKVLSKWIRDKHMTDIMLAFYFLSYCQRRLQKLPAENSIVKRLKKRLDKMQLELDKWADNFARDVQHIPFYPWVDILNQFLWITDEDRDLPLLSVPTHTPCWIDPKVFIERLGQYRQQEALSSSFDMQVAIQRLDLRKAKDMLPTVNDQARGIYLELFNYLFDPQKTVPDQIEHPELWLACTFPWYGREVPEHLKAMFSPNLSDPFLLGKFQWETYQKEYINRQYNWEKKAYEDCPYTLPRLRFSYDYFPMKDLTGKYYIGAFMWIGFPYYADHFCWDMANLLTLFPNNPEVLLARFIGEYVQTFDKDYDNALISVMELLKSLNRPLLPMGTLYFALCLLYQGNTTRTYAAETWLYLTGLSHINQQETGRYLGKLLQNGHAPLKRFTDVLYNIMLNHSPLHNRHLEQLIIGCLSQLDENPIPQLKKLLEAYKELLAQNGSHADTVNIPMLQTWGEGSLKKLINEIKEK